MQLLACDYKLGYIGDDLANKHINEKYHVSTLFQPIKTFTLSVA